MKQQGFTIVELIVVVVVLGLLAAVSIVGYSTVSAMAKKNTKVTNMRDWERVIRGYKAIHDVYPGNGAGGYCLGSGFPDGDNDGLGECRDFKSTNDTVRYQEEDQSELYDMLAEVSTTLPDVPKTVIQNKHVGPWYYRWGEGYAISDFFEGECPEPLEETWRSSTDVVVCRLSSIQ